MNLRSEPQISCFSHTNFQREDISFSGSSISPQYLIGLEFIYAKTIRDGSLGLFVHQIHTNKIVPPMQIN
jgi:hypothetical protein